MKLKNFLYLTQLEEYDINRIKTWLKNNPDREVAEIKSHLVWTTKIKILNIISKLLFFLPPEQSVFLGINLLQPFDTLSKNIIVALAKLKLQLFHPTLNTIVITGSWGKTTCKETLLQILSTTHPTSSTVANQNTLLGVAMRILKLPTDTKYFICEAGMYQPGDIAAICNLVKPKIGIITAIGPMHLERAGSLENILKTKMELAESLPIDGQLYLPEDQKKSIQKFTLKVKNIQYFNQLDTVYHHLGQLLTVPQTKIETALTSFKPSSHRQDIIKNGTLQIVDDTYNSNPVGFEMALKKLVTLKSNNNILVTPGMIELGSLQAHENSRLIKLADSLCQHLVLVGHTNRAAFKSALTKPKSKVYYVENIAEAQALLSTISTPHSAILFENDLPDQYF